MIVNRVNVNKFKETVEKAKKDPLLGKKTVQIEGEWRLNADSGPQFEARIQTETGGEYVMQSDETIALGGGGSAPNPVQCCVYGLIACYAATFAKWAAMDGIIFRSFKIKAIANVDLTRSYGISDNPILDSLKWEMIVDTDASMEELERLNEMAKERYPGYYCVTHEIFPEIKTIKQ